MSEPSYYDPWNETGRVATGCHESTKPTHSQILGPDGKPLAYKPNPIGFDLRPRDTNRHHTETAPL
jgi:hypothetical protein